MKKLLYISILFISLLNTGAFAQTPIWGFGLGGPSNDYSRACRVSANGNVLVTGSFYGTMNLNPTGAPYNVTSNGANDIFLACYSSTGTFLWGFNIGGVNSDGGYNVTTDVFNNVYICGFFQGGANFNPLGTAYILPYAGGLGLTTEGDAFIAKYSSTGVFQWAQDLGGTTVYDYNEALGTDPLGDVYVAGIFDISMVISPTITLSDVTAGSAFLIKYDPAGNLVWGHNFGEVSTGADNNCIIRSMQVDNGYIYACGFFTGLANFQPWGTATMLTATGGGFGIVSNDAFVAKYDTAGNLIFVNQIGGTGNDEEMEALVLDASDNIYLSGFSNSPSITYDFTHPATSTVTAPGAGSDYNIMMAKYSSTGVYQWGQVFGTTAGDNMGRAIDIAGGDLFCSGTFSGTVNFNSAGVANLTSAGGTDIFITKYDLNGNYLCGFRVGGSDDDAGYGLSHDALGNIFSSGQFEGTAVDFDPSSGVFPLTSLGGTDAYLVKYNPACIAATINPCLTNSLIINTGYDPITNTAITPGTNGGTPIIDPHWILSDVSPGVATAIASTPIAGLIEVVPGSNADVIQTIFGSWASNPTGEPGNWISCLNSNTYYDCLCGTPYNQTLGRPFRMCADDTVTFTLNIANDNYISATDVDGIALPFTETTPPSTTYFSTFTSFTYTMFLTAGPHTLHFLVNNYNVFTGSPNNPTGLDVYGTVSSATGTNSLVSEGSTACNAYVCGGSCPTLSMPDTLRLCRGDTTTILDTLSNTDSVLSISWSPTTGLSYDTVLDPLLTATASGWYALTVQSLIPYNYVVNGDFSGGNTGFSSGYIYDPTVPPPATSSIPGDYQIATNPYPYNNAWPVMGDHTTGTGNMMILDADTTSTAAVNFWCETFTVTPNTNYLFSVWSALLYPPLPSVQVMINGYPVGIFSTSVVQGQWVKYELRWNSGTATTANICMTDLSIVLHGNDFAIDDISFQQICSVTDSVYIKVLAPDTSFTHTDTSVCPPLANITLNAPSSYTTQLWNTGATTPSVSVPDSGTYWVSTTGACLLNVDTFNVSLFPRIYPVASDTVEGCAYLISLSALPDSANYNYQWVGPNDFTSGYRQPTIKNGQAANEGTYSVTITDINTGCSATATTNVTINPLPPAHLTHITPTQTINYGSSVQLNVDSAVYYWWMPDDGSLSNRNINNPVASPTHNTVYTVYGLDSAGCEDSATIIVDVITDSIIIPSAFTPNGDGLNDIFRPIGMKYQDLVLFNVYNRWGQLVFSTNNKDLGWDGTFNNVKQDMDVYNYMIIVGLDDGTTRMFKGNVTLIR